MTDIAIGGWVRRRSQKWHLVDSIVAGDVVTRCGRRMADKPTAPFQVSEVTRLTRAIGQPQLCKAGCDREPARHPNAATFDGFPEDDATVGHEPVEATANEPAST